VWANTHPEARAVEWDKATGLHRSCTGTTQQAGQAEVDDILATVGLAGFDDASPKELSGGMATDRRSPARSSAVPQSCSWTSPSVRWIARARDAAVPAGHVAAVSDHDRVRHDATRARAPNVARLRRSTRYGFWAVRR